MIRLFIIIISFLPTLVNAKCFSYLVTEMERSGLLYSAEVLSIKAVGKERCVLTLKFPEITADGEGEGALCNVKTGDKVKVKVRTYCCDNNQCDKSVPNKIWFINENT